MSDGLKEYIAYYFVLGFRHSLHEVAGGLDLSYLPFQYQEKCREAYTIGFNLQGQTKNREDAYVNLTLN